jgi:hypothetical protein
MTTEFRSGEWVGWYKYPDGKQTNTSAVIFFFPGHVAGYGNDEVGDFYINGAISGTHLTWDKQYVGKHLVKYDGNLANGSITGKWDIPGSWGGPFQMSPREPLAPRSPPPDEQDLPTSWINILIDQMKKAVKGEPSVFSPGFAPFGVNLLWKNLSIQEIRVIFQKLRTTEYSDVLQIYYHTYIYSIQIANDSERNAKRHVYWQISLYNRFGATFAKQLGDAHEVGRPGSDEDNRVDELNNQVALQYAATHPGSDAKKTAELLWSQGKLHGYADDPKGTKHWDHDEF